jgi:hypothetical protein
VNNWITTADCTRAARHYRWLALSKTCQHYTSCLPLPCTDTHNAAAQPSGSARRGAAMLMSHPLTSSSSRRPSCRPSSRLSCPSPLSAPRVAGSAQRQQPAQHLSALLLLGESGGAVSRILCGVVAPMCSTLVVTYIGHAILPRCHLRDPFPCSHKMSGDVLQPSILVLNYSRKASRNKERNPGLALLTVLAVCHMQHQFKHVRCWLPIPAHL